jgi:hypothetical protein
VNKRIPAVIVGLAAATVMAAATTASASVTINADGTGFVGKGDVQTVLGLNNNQMQSTPVSFATKSVTEQGFGWDCVKYTYDKDGNIKKTIRQERANVTTTDVTAVVSNVARVKNQITGYNLTGLGAATTTSVTDGPAPFSCPDDNPNPAEPKFALDPESAVTGAPTVLSQGLFVNGVNLPITPAIVVPTV